MFTRPSRYRISMLFILLAMLMGGFGNTGENKRGASISQAAKIIDSARHFIEIKRFDKANDLLLRITPVEDSMPGVAPDTLFLIWSLCGEVNISVRSYDRAFVFYSKALKIAEMPEYNTRLPQIYMQLAEYYTKISDSTMAFQYLDKAKLLLAPGPGNFSMLAELYLRNASYSSNRAEKEANLLKALNCSDKSEDKYLMAATTNELGLFYRETGREMSFDYFRRALHLWKEIKSDHNAMNTCLDIIEANIVNDNYKLAVNQLDSFNILFRGSLPEYIRIKY